MFPWAALCAAVVVLGNEYPVDDTPGLARRFVGVGGISGGGATSKLLLDYTTPAVSTILDLLFKPQYGASLHWLKVEMGGDADATEGAEPSHMHFAGDENYERGYEWWLMTEAKKRHPGIILHGLPWAWPGFLSKGGSAPDGHGSPYDNIPLSTNYTLAWVLAAKRVYNLDIDFMGDWNERASNTAYHTALQKLFDAHGLKTKAGVTGPHYPGNGASPAKTCGTDVNVTQPMKYVDEEGSIAGYRSARCLARVSNRHYVTGCYQGMLIWHLISAFYDYMPWAKCGLMVANTPWSGFYEITPPLWAVAHTTQFAQPGWFYLHQDHGVGFLKGGGSYVTLTNGSHFSIIVEKMGYPESSCARGSDPDTPVSTETVTFTLAGSMAGTKSLIVWYSNFNESSTTMFVKKPDLAVTNGKVTLVVGRNDIFTLTTWNGGQQKAQPPVPPPTPNTLPFPYKDNFDHGALSKPGKYFYDVMGAWEVHKDTTGGGRGQVLRQMTPQWPICWGYNCLPAWSYFGDGSITGAQISVDINIETKSGGFYFGFSDKALLVLYSTGSWAVFNGRPTTWSSVPFAKGSTSPFKGNSWHTAVLKTTQADHAEVWVDGKQILNKFPMGGLHEAPGVSGVSKIMMGQTEWFHSNIDNWSVTPPPPPSCGKPTKGMRVVLDDCTIASTNLKWAAGPGGLHLASDPTLCLTVSSTKASNCHGSGNECFTLELGTCGKGFVLKADGSVFDATMNECVDIKGETYSPGADLITYGCKDSPSSNQAFRNVTGSLVSHQPAFCIVACDPSS